ncbi:uncharacterized protein LOC108952939 [Musa acuminata AAA Group]|uniref:uncharacterized protein LOC108952939 n=1 Tax=Musa acuminata AAA Group TaxID=214697 RepID=UPI0031CEE75D
MAHNPQLLSYYLGALSEMEITPGTLTLEKKRKLDDSDLYLDLSSDVKEIILALKHASKNSTGVVEQGDCIEVYLREQHHVDELLSLLNYKEYSALQFHSIKVVSIICRSTDFVAFMKSTNCISLQGYRTFITDIPSKIFNNLTKKLAGIIQEAWDVAYLKE